MIASAKGWGGKKRQSNVEERGARKESAFVKQKESGEKKVQDAKKRTGKGEGGKKEGA